MRFASSDTTGATTLDYPLATVQSMAKLYNSVKICSKGDRDDCVQSNIDTFPIRMLRQVCGCVFLTDSFLQRWTVFTIVTVKSVCFLAQSDTFQGRVVTNDMDLVGRARACNQACASSTWMGGANRVAAMVSSCVYASNTDMPAVFARTCGNANGIRVTASKSEWDQGSGQVCVYAFIFTRLTKTYKS